jgi:hypothetical protein
MRNVKWNLSACVVGLLLAAAGAEAATFTPALHIFPASGGRS